MSISTEVPDKSTVRFQRAYRPTTALATEVAFDDDMMRVTLTDGRLICVPIIWFPLLHAATSTEREHYEIDGGGISIHWPDIDEDISVAGLLDGADRAST